MRLMPRLQAQTWNLCIPQEKLANCMWSYQVPECTAMACAHMESDVGNWHTTLAKACIHRSFYLWIDSVTSTIVWAHRPGDIRCGFHASQKRHHIITSNIGQGLHASHVARGNQLSDIVRDINASPKIHRSTTCNINECLQSIVAWAHRLGCIVVSLHSLTKWRRTTIWSVSEGLHASNVVYEHIASITAQRHFAFSKAYMHNLWCVCIIWVTSTAVGGRNHKPRLICFV